MLEFGWIEKSGKQQYVQQLLDGARELKCFAVEKDASNQTIFCFTGRFSNRKYSYNYNNAKYGRFDSGERQQHQRQHGTVVKFDHVANEPNRLTGKSERKEWLDDNDTPRNRLLDRQTLASHVPKCIFSFQHILLDICLLFIGIMPNFLHPKQKQNIENRKQIHLSNET